MIEYTGKIYIKPDFPKEYLWLSNQKGSVLETCIKERNKRHCYITLFNKESATAIEYSIPISIIERFTVKLNTKAANLLYNR